jgi:hypothetical protein
MHPQFRNSVAVTRLGAPRHRRRRPLHDVDGLRDWEYGVAGFEISSGQSFWLRLGTFFSRREIHVTEPLAEASEVPAQ